jgi:hypothetical protein
VVAREGDTARAKKLAEESGDITRRSGRKRVEESSELARETAHRSGIASALFAIGARKRMAGDFIESRKSFDEALAVRVALDERVRAAETRVALARLSLDEGHAADAEALVRTALDVLESANIAAERAIALGVLARALAAQGHIAEAKAALANALPLAPGDVATHLLVRFAAAQVRAVAKEGAARTDLEAVRVDATRAGFFGIARDAERELQSP